MGSPGPAATPTHAPTHAPTAAPTATATATATPAPNASGGIFAGSVATTAAGPTASPIAIPEPSGSPATLAELATLLDASKPPPAGSAIGTVGTVMSAGATSIVIAQLPMFPATAADGTAIPLVSNVALVGAFATPLTVTVDQNTTFAGIAGTADVRQGMTILAGGYASGSTLQARLIAPLGYTHASASVAARTPIGLPGVAPLARVRDAYDQVDQDHFSGQLTSPGFDYETTAAPVVTRSSPITCYNVGRAPIGQGALVASFEPQDIVSSPDIDADFPFAIAYDSSPPAFLESGAGFSGPGPASQWLKFVAEAGTANEPTVELTARAVFGAKLFIQNTCPGNQSPMTLASAVTGFQITSNSSAPLPGAIGTVKLQPVSCLGLNSPYTVNIFDVDSPFGNPGTVDLKFCDLPTILGNYVFAQVSPDIDASATINNPNILFDPGGVGPISVRDFGTITPKNPQVSFDIDDYFYSPAYIDGYELSYAILGAKIAATSGGRGTYLEKLTAASDRVAISATNTQLCGTVTSGNAFLGLATDCPSGAIDFEFCRDTARWKCPAEASGTSGTVKVTEGNYHGSFRVVDNGTGDGPLGLGCENGVVQTYPVTVTPRQGSAPATDFTISIGAVQTPGDDAGCNVYIEDDIGRSIQISLQFISYQ